MTTAAGSKGFGSKGFVRTKVSATERLISTALLVGIAGIGIAIFQAGQSYDESLFGLDPAALAAPATGRVAANTIVISSSGGSVAAVDGPARWLTEVRPGGWKALGEAESFDAANLYVKINGRAEQYLAFDVVGLDCISFTDPSGRFLDVFLYEMGTPSRAFGIFAVELDQEAPPVDLGRGGYQSGASLFFWQGNFYAQVLASETGEELVTAARSVAEALAGRIPDHGRAVPGMDWLPTDARMPGSLQYMVKDGLSLPFLTETWTADYTVDGAQVTLFVSVQESETDAQDVLEGYRGYLNDFGATITESAAHGGTALFGDMDGYYDVVLARGNTVAGAVLLEDPQLARRIADEWLPPIVTPEGAGGV